MAEDQTTSEELFTSSDAEGGSPNVSTTETKTEELNLSEENNASPEKETSSKEEAKEAQINAFYKKVKTGDISLDDLPNRQEWMRPFLEARLDSEAAKAKKSKELDIDALLEEKLALKEADQRFQDLKSSIDESGLTPDQKESIENEFKELRDLGIPKDKALEKSLKLAGVKASSRRSAMTPPTPNTVSSSDEEVTMDNFREKLPVGHPDRIKFLNMKTDPTQAKQSKFVNPIKTRNV